MSDGIPAFGSAWVRSQIVDALIFVNIKDDAFERRNDPAERAAFVIIAVSMPDLNMIHAAHMRVTSHFPSLAVLAKPWMRFWRLGDGLQRLACSIVWHRQYSEPQ